MIQVLLLEPFFGGSHKQLVDTVQNLLRRHHGDDGVKFERLTMPPKKWHWRARTSALFFAQKVPEIKFDVLFCSSVLNLAEFLALRPEFGSVKKIVYFHENQIAYPVQKSQDRDFQYGYNQVLTAKAADMVLFNSEYNLQSFLGGMKEFFSRIPDHGPNVKKILAEISPKCSVLYFPVEIPEIPVHRPEKLQDGYTLHIVWPHRWEFDKNPDEFFEILFELKEKGHRFRVSILGESFEEVPPVFAKAEKVLRDEIVHFGRLEDKAEYLALLAKADVAVSTANHEFFGVAMVEAAMLGCLPVVPDRLSYSEIYGRSPGIYRTNRQLFNKLRDLCDKPHLARYDWWPPKRSVELVDRFSANALSLRYLSLFNVKRAESNNA